MKIVMWTKLGGGGGGGVCSVCDVIVLKIQYVMTLERNYASLIKHKLGKPPRVWERQMAKIERCRLPFSF